MKEYDEKAPSKYIMYLDANNLYGWTMSQYLPTGNFKWTTDKEISKIDLGKYKADSKKGLILEVDLEYPQELHDNIYKIEAEDVYNDFWNDKDMFDNSNYPESSPYYCNVSKKIIGKFKDEACGILITEFIDLKSKMYSYVKDNEKGGRTTKGIKKNVIKNNIKHEDYKNSLINNEQMHHKMKTIRSQRHQLGSYEINKYRSAVLMTSATSIIMEQAVMPMDTTK